MNDILLSPVLILDSRQFIALMPNTTSGITASSAVDRSRNLFIREKIEGTPKKLHKDHMKTLTVTEAKKNLSRWLAAAAQGEDVGIVCGADIIALRKIEVESTDYAQREYAATREQIAALDKATDKRYRKLKRSGKLVTVSAEQLRKMLE